MKRKTKKFDPTQIALDILNQYTKPSGRSEGWDFPLGLIGDIADAVQEAYIRGTKKELRHAK